MKIELTNLAQIEHALFQNQDLTVLIGDNGTGKTLLLETISLLNKFHKSNLRKHINEIIKEKNDLITVDTDWEKIKQEIQRNLDKVNDDKDEFPYLPIIDGLKINISVKESKIINETLKKEIEGVIPKGINLVNKEVLFEKESNFTYKLHDLPSIEYSNDFEFELISFNDSKYLSLTLKKGNREQVDTLSVNNLIVEKQKLMESENIKFNKISTEDILESINNKLKEMMFLLTYQEYFGDGQLLFLPSERNLLMDGALKRAALSSTNLSVSRQRYSENLFHEAYFNFKDITESHPQLIARLSKSLEGLFGGPLTIGEKGEIKAIKREDGTFIKRELFSTKQNRMIPYLMIHSPIGNYQSIIIEEPEAHLSIKSMNEFLIYILGLIRSRRSLCLTTHSDVFFSRLNNVLLKEQDIQANVYELKSNGITSWLEKKDKSESGYKIDLFSEELNKLYDETLEIQQNKIDR